MGCFDFTYADNGRNIRGGSGYLYITEPVMKALGLKHPYLRFTDMDCYGNMTLKNATVDIYAVYSAMLAMDDATKKYIKRPDLAAEFLDLLKQKNRDENRMELCMDEIRCDSIEYFFTNIKDDTKPCIGLPKMGNQPAKAVTTQGTFKGVVPLLVTRKRMDDTLGKDAKEIAANLLVVTASDPKQGCGLTKNHWLKYEP